VCTELNDRRPELLPALLLKVWDVRNHESNGLFGWVSTIVLLGSVVDE
jgi:hypothetical protein